MSLTALLKAWDKFFFKPQSPLPVAILRIAYGLLLVLMTITQYMPDWDFWYGSKGPVEIDALRDFFFRCPVLDLFDIIPPSGSHIFMWMLLVASVCLTIGLCSRLSAAFCWLALVSVDHHNPWNISGCDDMMRFVAFGLMLSYCGKMLSVDAWWQKRFHPERVKSEYPPWGQRVLQIQLAVSYWGASVAKLGGAQWVDGTALWYSSHFQDFYRLPVGHLFDSFAFCQFLAWSTLGIETALWTLVWFKEFRYWVLLSGVLLHIGIDYTMTLPIFEMLFVACYVTFIEPDDLLKLGRWVRSLWSPRGSSKQTSAPPAVAVVTGQASNSA